MLALTPADQYYTCKRYRTRKQKRFKTKSRGSLIHHNNSLPWYVRIARLSSPVCVVIPWPLTEHYKKPPLSPRRFFIIYSKYTWKETGRTLIKTARANLNPHVNAFEIWKACLAANRVISHLKEYLESNHDPLATVSQVRATLESILHVGGLFTVTDAAGDTDEHECLVGYFDEATGMVLMAVFIGDVAAESEFYSAFNLTPEEAVHIKEDTLGFLVARIPQDTNANSIPAVAVVATGDDGWLVNAYTVTDTVRNKIIAAARTALPEL